MHGSYPYLPQFTAWIMSCSIRQASSSQTHWPVGLHVLERETPGHGYLNVSDIPVQI